MQDIDGKIEIIPLLLLRGRSVLFKEYSTKELKELSRTLRSKGFEKVYIMDLDGIERNKPQLDIIQRLSDDFSVMVEAGPRRGVNIIDLVIAGADVAYMNTASMESINEIEIALSYTENVGLKIDWNNGLVGNEEVLAGNDLDRIMQRSNEKGIRDFILPVEIFNNASNIRLRNDAILRALADRPGDEKRTDLKAESIIINYEILRRGEKIGR